MPKDTITPKRARKPRVPAAQTTAMDTDLPPPTDQEICDELKTIQGKLMILQSQITITEKPRQNSFRSIKILPICYDEPMENLMTRKSNLRRHRGKPKFLQSQPYSSRKRFRPLRGSGAPVKHLQHQANEKSDFKKEAKIKKKPI
ncbi:hypothetical protein TNIN_74741 [Trichonephila inaurata madagascariensis]|uniref:Uncharacterized protein n=1 Tax=Trichonephila inaurata madagascariensis TaxID=2747483 RepID=A0A8X7BVE1_9ARAC|nr:hypothetical protein TNIN_74741 [Trichonephila inaurata madagascariensis]